MQIFVKTLTGKTITLEVSVIYLVTRAFRLNAFTADLVYANQREWPVPIFLKRSSNAMARMFYFRTHLR